MSGLVMTRREPRRMRARSGTGVSPSKTSWRIRPPERRKLRDAAALVTRQRLGGEEKQGPRRPVPRERVEDRQVVAEALAAGRWRGDDDVVPVADGVDRLGLVRVQRLDSGAPEGALERGAQRLPKLPVRGLPFGDGLHVRDLAAVARQRLQVTKEAGDVHVGDCTAAAASRTLPALDRGPPTLGSPTSVIPVKTGIHPRQGAPL